MNDTLNNLLGLYLSISGSSIIMNLYLNEKAHIKGKKKCMRHLKYKKGLHYSTKNIIRYIDIDHVFDNLHAFLWSLIPVCNVIFTFESIDNSYEFEDFTDETYEEIIEEANENEENTRKQNAKILRSLKDSLTVIPDDIDIDDYNARPTTKETKKILRLNHIKYNKDLYKIDKGE